MDKRSNFNFSTVAVMFVLVLMLSSEVQAKHGFRRCILNCVLSCLTSDDIPTCIPSCLPKCGIQTFRPPAAGMEGHQPLTADTDTLNLSTDTPMAQTVEALDKCMNDECGVEECGGISNKACPPSSS